MMRASKVVMECAIPDDDTRKECGNVCKKQFRSVYDKIVKIGKYFKNTK